MATLNTRIAIFAGHDVPKDGAAPDWIGTVGEFHAANADFMDGDDLQAMLDGLDADGRHLIGGGAEAAFILLKIEPVRPLAAPAEAWPFRDHRSQAEVAA